MEAVLSGIPTPAVLRPAQPMTDEEFMRFSERNNAFKMERASNGDLLILSPTGSDGSVRNMEISAELYLWNREFGGGAVLESSGGMTLPDGSIRSPDAAWISKAKWAALSPKQREGYAPVCPEFVSNSCLRRRTGPMRRPRWTCGSAMARSLPG